MNNNQNHYFFMHSFGASATLKRVSSTPRRLFGSVVANLLQSLAMYFPKWTRIIRTIMPIATQIKELVKLKFSLTNFVNER